MPNFNFNSDNQINRTLPSIHDENRTTHLCIIIWPKNYPLFYGCCVANWHDWLSPSLTISPFSSRCLHLFICEFLCVSIIHSEITAIRWQTKTINKNNSNKYLGWFPDDKWNKNKSDLKDSANTTTNEIIKTTTMTMTAATPENKRKLWDY